MDVIYTIYIPQVEGREDGGANTMVTCPDRMPAGRPGHVDMPSSRLEHRNIEHEAPAKEACRTKNDLEQMFDSSLADRHLNFGNVAGHV